MEMALRSGTMVRIIKEITNMDKKKEKGNSTGPTGPLSSETLSITTYEAMESTNGTMDVFSTGNGRITK